MPDRTMCAVPGHNARLHDGCSPEAAVRGAIKQKVGALRDGWKKRHQVIFKKDAFFFAWAVTK
jgi:hypothetical protein